MLPTGFALCQFQPDAREPTFHTRVGRAALRGIDRRVGSKSVTGAPTDSCHVTRVHDGMAGIYAAVLVEEIVRKGDPIWLVYVTDRIQDHRTSVAA
jgi:hypothetical protein